MNSILLSQLTNDTIFVFLLKSWKSRKYKAQSRHNNKEARDYGNHLGLKVIVMYIFSESSIYFAGLRPSQRRNDADFQTGSTNVSVSLRSNRCQNPPQALLAVTSEKWVDKLTPHFTGHFMFSCQCWILYKKSLPSLFWAGATWPCSKCADSMARDGGR